LRRTHKAKKKKQANQIQTNRAKWLPNRQLGALESVRETLGGVLSRIFKKGVLVIGVGQDDSVR
jgi:hypothetical protein